MQDFEKLGAFYLGRPFDLRAGKPLDGLILYDAKDLVTHAVCVGMTGSGKTGLCIGVLEEAAFSSLAHHTTRAPNDGNRHSDPRNQLPPTPCTRCLNFLA